MGKRWRMLKRRIRRELRKIENTNRSRSRNRNRNTVRVRVRAKIRDRNRNRDKIRDKVRAMDINKGNKDRNDSDRHI